MNDKKFIEELRQKREEYGVSQRRLAVACGISLFFASTFWTLLHVQIGHNCNGVTDAQPLAIADII